MDVVKKGGIRREALFTHKLFRVQSPIGAVKTDMALAGNFPGHPVVRHIVSLDAEAARVNARPLGRSPSRTFPLRTLGVPTSSLPAPSGE
jgi:hypothetical protein